MALFSSPQKKSPALRPGFPDTRGLAGLRGRRQRFPFSCRFPFAVAAERFYARLRRTAFGTAWLLLTTAAALTASTAATLLATILVAPL